VEALAGAKLLLIVLEDVHWADEMSLRLLSFLARRPRTTNIVIAVTCREEEMLDTPLLVRALDEIDATGRLVWVNLGPLSREDAGVLVRALARVDADQVTLDGLVEQAWAISEGNPFMIVETLRALREGSAVWPTSGLPMPERVRRLVAARLDRLGDSEQRLLAMAAVIGREFDFALVQRAADLNEHDAARSVEELVRRRVFQVVDERLDFTHDRIRTVVRDRLLPPSRTVLHAAVARAIEALYATTLDAHAAALGLHYREAGIWDRAVTYAMLAARQSLSRSAYRDAVSWYERALDGLDHLPATQENRERAVDVRLGLWNAVYHTGAVAGSFELLQQAETIAQDLGGARRLGRTLPGLALHAWISGRPATVQALSARALAIADDTDDRALRVVATYFCAHGFLGEGDLPRAIARFRDVARLLEDPTTRKTLPPLAGPRSGVHRAYLGWCLAEQGRFTEAIQHGLGAVRDAEASDVAHSLVQAWARLALIHALKGDYPGAAELAERAMAIARAREVVLFVPFLQWFVGHTWARCGRIAEGASLLSAGVEQLEAWRLWGWVPLALVHLGEVYALTGRADDAKQHAVRALGLARELGQRLYEGYALRLLGESLAQRDAACGEEHYRKALTLAAELGMRPLAAHCHLGLGKLYRCTGQREQAQEHLTTAAAAYREMDMRFYLDQAEAETK
jgi:tetratricopeptide (TPR) repeat protein